MNFIVTCIFEYTDIQIPATVATIIHCLWVYRQQTKKDFFKKMKWNLKHKFKTHLLTLWAFLMLSSPYSEFWKAIRMYLFSKPSIDNSCNVLLENIPYHCRKFPNSYRNRKKNNISNKATELYQYLLLLFVVNTDILNEIFIVEPIKANSRN